jgi:1-acyl-sn-glycerol-3-phosphate acyltransferase
MIEERMSALARAILPQAELDRLARIKIHDEGNGFDAFGMHPDGVAVSVALLRFLHRKYFRVTSHDASHIPADGPVILAANHSGTLPLDAAMLYADVIQNTDPPRVPRPLADLFVPRLPFISTMFARAGVIGGARANAHRLLDDGELLMVFPEGVPGIAKPFRERYHLKEWRVGHAELAIRHRAPVVPVAIIGAEEQWPQIARITRFHPLGVPHLPIPLTPLPLPVHYHIHYGAPIFLHETWPPEQADDPVALADAAARVKAAVVGLIATGLAGRAGIFR